MFYGSTYITKHAIIYNSYKPAVREYTPSQAAEHATEQTRTEHIQVEGQVLSTQTDQVLTGIVLCVYLDVYRR